MPSIRSLTAALALTLAAPFAGAHTADNCAEAVSIKSASKGDKIAPATDSKQAAKTHDAAMTANQPVQAKMGSDPRKPQAAAPSADKKTAWPKAFQKYKGHCC